MTPLARRWSRYRDPNPAECCSRQTANELSTRDTRSDVIAKKRRRRPSAGPPPIKNARHEARLAAEQSGASAPSRTKLPAGAPVKPTFKSVVIRSLIATVLFVAILSAMGNPPPSVAVTGAMMFLILLGFGWMFDNMLHKWRLKRWTEKRAAAGRRQ